MAYGSVNVPGASEVELTAHKNDKSNPHQVTAAQVGAIPTTEKGVANGVATLGSDGKVPSTQLPEMNYDPAGSAAGVQANLTAHINNRNNPHQVTASQIGAVPTARTVNGKPLTGNISLTAGDVGAATKGYVDNAVSSAAGCKMQIVSYNGDDTYDEDNPTSVTFDFVPQIVGFLGWISGNRYYYYDNTGYVVTSWLTTDWQSGGLYKSSGFRTKKSSDGKTISWYGANAAAQQNKSGQTYYVVGMG